MDIVYLEILFCFALHNKHNVKENVIIISFTLQHLLCKAKQDLFNKVFPDFIFRVVGEAGTFWIQLPMIDIKLCSSKTARSRFKSQTRNNYKTLLSSLENLALVKLIRFKF